MIALVDQLVNAGWAKRVLFLADRQALVKQATNAFKTHLPGVPTVNLLKGKGPDGAGIRLDLPDDDGPGQRDRRG